MEQSLLRAGGRQHTVLSSLTSMPSTTPDTGNSGGTIEILLFPFLFKFLFILCAWGWRAQVPQCMCGD